MACAESGGCLGSRSRALSSFESLGGLKLNHEDTNLPLRKFSRSVRHPEVFLFLFFNISGTEFYHSGL